MTVNELDFKPHPLFHDSKQAVIHFENGYGASIIAGGWKRSYTCESHPYEIAVLKGDKVCYDTPITSDVLGWQLAEDVEKVLNQIASLID